MESELLPNHLQVLSDTAAALMPLYETCKSDPVNLNNLYTVIGLLCKSIVIINHHLSSTLDK